MSNTLYRFVKASERLPEITNNRGEWQDVPVKYIGQEHIFMMRQTKEHGFLCDNKIYGNISWLEEVKEADQQELWEEIKKDISTADKAHVPLKLIVEWKKRYTLLPNKEPDVQGCDTTEVK